MLQATPEVNHISDIIKVMNSGIEFYQEAKGKVDSAEYTGFFNRMIDAKQEAVADLQKFAVAETGDLENGSDTMTEARKAYTNLVDKVSSTSTETNYVDQLEEVEDKVLAEISTALDKDQAPDCEVTLRRVHTRMKECHDEMRMLKKGITH
ncbi:PA2169 family four-helix-bundle protein [Marinomonas atlantica]|uniref:PA2169 family four-helix-bundle protein n=1 Tax=Marinomonas atlantica TaxID=1806668 RepID=UPI00082ECAE8|nr:PA2169 family four-helix-bundle protein [Marinomonas atlantica]MCO4786734.1 PA2169 family four-helix-bundle protein [Marinomonas atlantica]